MASKSIAADSSARPSPLLPCHLPHGYQRFALKTDDWRLPAVNMYRKLGWKPWLFDDDMPGRWQALCQKLQIDERNLIKFNRYLQPCHS